MRKVTLNRHQEEHLWMFIYVKIDIAREHDHISPEIFDEYSKHYAFQYSSKELEEYIDNVLLNKLQLTRTLPCLLIIFFCYHLHIPLDEEFIKRLEKHSYRYELNSDKTIVSVSSREGRLIPRPPDDEAEISAVASTIKTMIGVVPPDSFLKTSFWINVACKLKFKDPEYSGVRLKKYFKKYYVDNIWMFNIDIKKRLEFIETLNLKVNFPQAVVLRRQSKNDCVTWNDNTKQLRITQEPDKVDDFVFAHLEWTKNRNTHTSMEYLKLFGYLKKVCRDTSLVNEDYWRRLRLFPKY